jgi:cell division protein FtsI/penicillin-binding protein 2
VQKEGKKLQENHLAANAFGQGVNSITPFQMALFNNAIANDGQLMKPRLVMRITDSKKNPLKTFGAEPLGARQISNQTAQQTRQAMQGVVLCGSGSIVHKLVNSGAAIIGKTGTAEVGEGKGAHSWMITQAPYSVNNPSQLPALTIVAMKENGGEGGAVVGPMIADIYSDVFKNGYVKVQVPSVPSADRYCCQTGLLQMGC